MSSIHRGLWWFKNRFPRLAWRLRWLRPSRIMERRRFLGRSTQQVFERIYNENRWGMEESRSGAGSTLSSTEQLRRDLPAVVARLGAKSFLDAPCGDFNWMQHCELGVAYIGADIVPQLVEQVRVKHERTDRGTTRTFMHLDITKDPLPEADVFFCRDCMLHLSFEHISGVLENFRRSKCKWLIASTYSDLRMNWDHFTGGVRMINLCLPPFNLPEPLEYIEDRGEAEFQRRLGVWSREQVLGAGRG